MLRGGRILPQGGAGFLGTAAAAAASGGGKLPKFVELLKFKAGLRWLVINMLFCYKPRKQPRSNTHCLQRPAVATPLK